MRQRRSDIKSLHYHYKDPPNRVMREIAGDKDTSFGIMHYHLGTRAFQLWRLLCCRRDAGTGCTSATNTKLSQRSFTGGKPLTERQCRRAASVLNKCGLLVTLKHKTRRVTSTGIQWLVTRVVYGDYRRDIVWLPRRCYDRVLMLVPKGTYERTAEHCERMSKKKKDRVKQANKFTNLNNETGFNTPARLWSGDHPEPRSCLVETGVCEIKQLPDGKYLAEWTGDSNHKRSATNHKRAPMYHYTEHYTESSSKEEDRPSGAFAAGDLGSPAAPGASECTRVHSDGRSTLRQTRSTPKSRFARFENDFNPPQPTTLLIGTAVLPPAPKVPTDSTPEQRAAQLAKAYEGAVLSRYKERSWVFKQGVQNSKYKACLIDAAETLLDYDIAPAAWAAFSCDVWRHYGSNKGRKAIPKPPPVDWVFSSKRIVDRHGWFSHEGDSSSGGRLLFGAMHKELIDRWNAMHAVCLYKKNIGVLTTLEEAASVRDQYFPDGWLHLYEAASEEADDARVRIARMVKDGEFVW